MLYINSGLDPIFSVLLFYIVVVTALRTNQMDEIGTRRGGSSDEM